MTHYTKGTEMTARAKTLWTFAITSVALFMVTLDNLVVTTALPVIRKDLDASLSGLEWTVNAYTLTFAVLLLTGAALGDRFGRRLMFSIGLGIFTLASAAAALAPSIGALDAARAVQGLGGAIVMPLTLTILSAAVPPERRGLALGAWGGISGLAVAFGPLVGGAVVSGISWHWIFWLNVPIGLALVPLALLRLDETRGPGGRADLPGLALASAGLFALVWGLVRGNSVGLGSPEIAGAPVPGGAPGAPLAGALSDRVGAHKLIGVGLTLQAIGLAWIATVSTPTTPYADLVAAFTISGIGMGLFFAPIANLVLSSVRPNEEGKASGANSALRELGGVFGVAVLASVFADYGGYGSGVSFTDGMTPAVYVGAAVVALGAGAAFLAGRRGRQVEPVVVREPALDLAV